MKTVATPAAAREVEADSGGDSNFGDDVFLGAVKSDKGASWLTTVQLLGIDVKFKMDTGLPYNEKFEKFSWTLYGPTRQSLEFIGQFDGRLKRGKHTHSEKIYVVDLFDLSAITLYASSRELMPQPRHQPSKSSTPKSSRDWEPWMTERCAQIEKEAMTVTWACEKFTDYLLGRKF